jgi:tetratricopeptide (TPR) repeat protein
LISPKQIAPLDLIEAARTAVPNSVWIETVRARALGTVEAAEAAVRLDPNHVPAQVALAAEHERLGDHESTVRILRPIPKLDWVVGGPLLLARAAFALGDFELAATSAKRERDRQGSLIEPVSGLLMVGEARVLEGDAWLRLGQADKALSAFYAADRHRSLEGRERLCRPTAELERAMEARLRKHHLDDDLRGRLLEYLGTFRLRSGNVASGVRLFGQAAGVPNFYPSLGPLKQGGPAVREELEKLVADPHVPRRERTAVDLILKELRPDERAVHDPAGTK